MNQGIFKAYDIRGVYPTEIDEITVYAISRAYCEWLKPKQIALGRDVRTSGGKLFEEAKRACLESGVDVVDIGVISTDMLYFAVGNYHFDGGITITASHNPAEYNGMKMVREGARPISEDTGLKEIRDLTIKNKYQVPEKKGRLTKMDFTEEYVERLLHFIKPGSIKPFKIVANPNFGAVGKYVEKLAQELGFETVRLNFKPDGSFPKGRPDPLIPENRLETSRKIKETKADFGVAWDADADRCFFFDENGEFVSGYHTFSLLAKLMLAKYPKAKIVYDPRLYWATLEQIEKSGGKPIISKVGHSFIKEKMRKEGATFGGEMTGHYYFKDFYTCDNGLIPFLLILEKLSTSGEKLSELVSNLREKFPASEEQMFQVDDSAVIYQKLEKKYSDAVIEHIDGLSVEYPEWRFNIRGSNTEPVIKLNLEAKTATLVEAKIVEIKALIMS